MEVVPGETLHPRLYLGSGAR